MTFSRPYTRAMPSPTEITLPVSLTSTPARYSSICSRMILLISSALISMPLRFLGQAVFECLQLCADRTVVDRAADLGHHASDQRCIDGHFHSDFLAGLL